MDLLSTIRKSGSRGGVNFSWDDVASSTHRENYLGHSLKAPVGRWAKGRELDWYAKSDSKPADSTSAVETETNADRERREELRRIKETEEDAIARALGLPVKVRDTTGANAVEVEPKREIGRPEEDAPRRERGERGERRTDRGRDRDRDRDRGHGRRRERSGERSRDRGREERRPRRDRDRRDRDRSRSRSRSPERRERRERRRDRERSRGRYRSRSREYRRRSPERGRR